MIKEPMTNKQEQDLLIQNGQLVADTLRHLADNEIDSDYFAITSTSENGTEIDHELVITEYALQAASTVDAMVEALESAQATAAHSNRGWAEAHEQEARAESAEKRIAELENDEVRQRLANAEHQLHMAELAKHNLRASRMAQFKKRKAAEKRISELEVRAIKFPPKVERDDSDGYWMLKGQRVSAANAAYYNEALKDVALALFAAGIKCEVKGE